jgi:L-Ala-D/L-Glu epimerase
MTIVSSELSRGRIALRTPFVTALRRVEYAEFILLTLRTDDDRVAYGSAPATEAITGETLTSIEKALATAIIPALLHRPFALDELVAATNGAIEKNSSAKAAAEMALFALAAAAKDEPLYRLLGGTAAPELRTAVTVSLNTPDIMQSVARRYVSEGLDILKIKVGANDGHDAERIRKIAQAVADATLLVDANQAWDVAASMAVIDAVADLPIALIEQPVPACDLAGLKEINDRSPFPILADEAVFSAEDAKRVLDAGAADLVNIKLMKSGGIAGALEIIDICRAYGKSCMLGSMLEGPVSITAALHLAAAHPDIFTWIDLDSPLLYRTLPPDLPFSVRGNQYVL